MKLQFMLLFAFIFIQNLLLATDFSRVASMPDKEMIQFFVENGGGYQNSLEAHFDDEVRWINIKVRGDLPTHFDLRDLHPSGKLQPIKRQRCGDCWAHSVIATFESKWALAHPADPIEIYAQQEMISACGNTGGSCNGGYFSAFNYVVGKTGKGLPMEADLPYKGTSTSCNKTVEKKPRGVGWAYIGERYDLRGPTIEQMKQALIDYGSLSVDVHAFNHSGSAVYSSCASGSINHMVNIEGWQDDPNVQGGGYWYMRNSWGTSFGEDGYAKVAFKNKSGGKCAALGTTVAVVTKLE